MSLKLPLLFVASVVLPALFLAYMGFQAVEDDRDRALEEQTRNARLLQEQFAGIIQDAVQALRQNARAAANGGYRIDYPSTAPIRQVFVLDDRGNWIVPNIPARRVSTLPAAFKTRLSTAERLEFAARDIPQALAAYRQLAAQTEDPVERAIALNAAARCAHKQDDSQQALQLYAAIVRSHPLASDENGAHLATYAHLQIADLSLATGDAGGTLQTLGDWLGTFDRGAYPLYGYSGIRHALDRAEQILLSIRQPPEKAARPPEELADLRRRLDRARERVDFVEQYGSLIVPPDFTDQIALLQTGRDSVLYRAGHSREEPYLVAIAPLSAHRFVGAHLDLRAIHARLTAFPLGDVLRNSGLRVSILDDRAAAAFRQTHADAVPAVAGFGQRPIGLRIGLYAEDTASILAPHRQRRWLLFSLILLLTATIGFGGYLVTRDAARESKLSRLRSRFVADVSHELKTPLASIRLYAETLQLGRFREAAERDQCVDTILRESERLSRLVDNVLNFSRIDTGRRTYRLREEDLAAIVRSCLDTFGHRLREEGFALHADIPVSLPPVSLDRDGVTEAVLNLLDNAVKYSSTKKAIACRVHSTAGSAVLEIADQGIGIPKRERERIFATFHRVESNQLNVSGAGLGLTLVKHVMDAHQGRVEVDSAEDRGSTFRLVFSR